MVNITRKVGCFFVSFFFFSFLLLLLTLTYKSDAFLSGKFQKGQAILNVPLPPTPPKTIKNLPISVQFKGHILLEGFQDNPKGCQTPTNLILEYFLLCFCFCSFFIYLIICEYNYFLELMSKILLHHLLINWAQFWLVNYGCGDILCNLLIDGYTLC